MTNYSMESLKEFIYFDPTTKEKIVDPEVKLSFDKSGRPVWRNKKGQIARNPKLWVGAETKGEQSSLSGLPASNALSPNQVLTSSQINELEKAIKNKEVNAAAERASQDKKAIIKNLIDSGVLRDEVIKAVVNTEDLPILAKDFPKIRKAINKVIKVAIRHKLLARGFSAAEGIPAENDTATIKTAESIAKELLDRYLVLTKVQSGRKDYTYTLLSVPAGTPEDVTRTTPAVATDPAASNPSTPVQPSSNQVAPNSTDRTGKQPTGRVTITIDNKTLVELTEDLAVAIKPLLTETNEAIISSAKTVKYHCSITDSSQTDEPSQEVEKQNESKDSYILRRLLEEDTPSGDSVSQDGVTDGGEESAAKTGPEKVLTLDAVKAVVDGLNKKGATFDTLHATYKLSYSADNVDDKNSSFDILVTSSSTTPKEDFWTFFKKKAGKFLKATGATLSKAADVLASDGRMTF